MCEKLVCKNKKHTKTNGEHNRRARQAVESAGSLQSRVVIARIYLNRMLTKICYGTQNKPISSCIVMSVLISAAPD